MISLDAGDLIWIDLDPRTGREQSGRRPALVISSHPFHAATGIAIVCPITARIRPFPTSVVLPQGLSISGEVLVSHVRSIDLLARPVRSLDEAVLAAVLAEVRGKLAALTRVTG